MPLANLIATTITSIVNYDTLAVIRPVVNLKCSVIVKNNSIQSDWKIAHIMTRAVIYNCRGFIIMTTV